jgi:hypothetical protein
VNLAALRAAHPQACAELAAEERNRVLTHQQIGKAIDAPAIASEAIRFGKSVAATLPIYERAAAQHGTTSALKHVLDCLEIDATALAQSAAGQSAQGDFGDLVAAEFDRQRGKARDNGDLVAAAMGLPPPRGTLIDQFAADLPPKGT